MAVRWHALEVKCSANCDGLSSPSNQFPFKQSMSDIDGIVSQKSPFPSCNSFSLPVDRVLPPHNREPLA